MSEQQKQDSRDLVNLLKDLPQEDRLQVQGVIAGMKLARNLSTRTLFPLKKKGVCKYGKLANFQLRGNPRENRPD